MDSRSQAPLKSSSFSSATSNKATREVDRNLSLGALRHGDHDRRGAPAGAATWEQINEEGEEEDDDGSGEPGPGVSALSGEIDAFIAGHDAGVSIPEATLERFAAAVEQEIAQSEKARDKWAADGNGELLLAAIARVAALASVLAKNTEASAKYASGAHRVTAVLHHAMSFLEDEFHALLEPKAADTCKLARRPASFEQGGHEADRCVLRPPDNAAHSAHAESTQTYPPETVDRLRSIADTMVGAGYVTECTQMFLVARRNAFDASLRALGYDKASIDDVVRMTWEALETEIATWIKAFRHTIQPVPGGAVHPLTRYVMNYLKYTCEYNSTLEQVFREHRRRDDGGDNPFAAQLTDVMELLNTNLEGKSRLYKDPALSNIFLMNNGRYMLQKIRGSPETNAMLGETWARKQSTNLRQYHKNYQRETWNRVLTLLRDDGVLTVKGHVQKPQVKDRFKQFNSAMDEIHKTQGAWVVSDEQLQSELRVSIAAVVVPAYRSFLGRFAQTFSAGRQTEKYIKLSGEDVEGIIDELFDGNPSSMTRRR
ncbi:uncharacterized protein LOC124652243 [Lolium rigidum]|uniref:uncharacterized protein LOC124652243 n=1 Tax=Lolium rigidum TaxID=89674 RepID=UPI001F5CFE8F|nr:uncharacterized protein LOC124652243 [Lolium rigidum]